MAEDLGCKIKKNILDEIMSFWNEGTEIRTSQEMESVDLEAGISVENGGIFKSILKIFAKIKTDLKFNIMESDGIMSILWW